MVEIQFPHTGNLQESGWIYHIPEGKILKQITTWIALKINNNNKSLDEVSIKERTEGVWVRRWHPLSKASTREKGKKNQQISPIASWWFLIFTKLGIFFFFWFMSGTCETSWDPSGSCSNTPEDLKLQRSSHTLYGLCPSYTSPRTEVSAWLIWFSVAAAAVLAKAQCTPELLHGIPRLLVFVYYEHRDPLSCSFSQHPLSNSSGSCGKKKSPQYLIEFIWNSKTNEAFVSLLT